MSTTKILIGIGILVGILISVGVYFRISQPAGKTGEVVTAKSETVLTTEPMTDLAKYDFIRESLIKALEASMAAVNKRIDDLSKKQTTTTTGVTALTTAVIASTAPTASSAPTVKTLYIPMGYGGSSVSTTGFESIGSTEIAINPSDYPGYKQIVFEANMRIFQGNGQGEAQIYNKTDGTAVLNSLVSTTSQDYSTKASSGFTLTGGSKTYVVQLKSTTGYSVDLQLTRLRVDF